MSLGDAINTLGAGVSLATAIISGVGQVSNDSQIAETCIQAQAELQSEGYECATDDDNE